MKHELRAQVIAAAQKMSAQGLSRGTSGNVSVRTEGGMLITPTGMPYDELRPSDIVEVSDAGHVAGGQRLPSSEWRMHLGIYAGRPECGAIVHTHSMFATTLSILRRELPAVHYMLAVAGGSTVRCAPYATFGTEELARNAVAALVDRKACLLANHGLIALGADLGDAYRVASEVEGVAEEYWRALQLGQPHILDDAEMARVVDKFTSYGQQPKRRF
jgi:L-fuculose-phosphate aldolase